MRNTLACGALAIILALATACGSLYALPDPPPPSDWVETSLVPGQDDHNDAERYIAARTAALKLYEALSNDDWDTAWELISAETQSFLNYVAPEGDGKQALMSGRLKFPDGEEVAVDAVSLLLIRDLRDLDDDHGDEEQSETANRKEIFAVSDGGETKKVVLIFEGGAWRVHRTTAF
jgi:hypothetical protein